MSNNPIQTSNTDSYFAKSARRMVDHFGKNIKVFENFDHTLNADYHTELKHWLDAVEAIPDEKKQKKQQDGLQQQYEELIDALEQYTRKLYYFVRKIGKKDGAIPYRFGWHGNLVMPFGDQEWLAALQKWKPLLEEHREDFFAVGCHDTLLEQVDEYVTKIEQFEKARYVLRVSKDILAENRIQYLQILKKNLEIVREAAQLIFANNLNDSYPYLQLHHQQKETRVITVPTYKTKPILTPPLHARSIIHVFNSGNVPIKVYVTHKIQEVPDKGLILQPKQRHTDWGSKWSVDGMYDVLIARNDSGKEGKIEVEILE